MIPRRKTSLDAQDEMPFGMTHLNDTPCPFANDKLPVGYINTCCSFNTRTAVEALTTLGCDALAKLLQEELTFEKLPYVAKELRRAADDVEARYVEPMDTYDDPREGGITEQVRERFHPCLRPRFEAALASICQAADWYEKVGRLGFGVEVWY